MYFYHCIIKHKRNQNYSYRCVVLLKIKIVKIIKRPTRDACLCMGELPAPLAPPAPAAPPAPHFVFLITL